MKKTGIALLAGVMIVSMAGCGGGSAETTAAATTTAETTTTQEAAPESEAVEDSSAEETTAAEASEGEEAGSEENAASGTFTVGFDQDSHRWVLWAMTGNIPVSIWNWRRKWQSAWA